MLYLVRHGETELNWAGRMQGRMDSPLTARGRDQAGRVGEKLQAELGARPVTWLLDRAPVDARWCLIACLLVLKHPGA